VSARAAARRGRILAAILVAGASLAVHAPSIGNGFLDAWDDGEYVTGNPMVNRGVTADGVVAAFTRVHSYNWHPLTWISHMLDCEAYALDPRGHHLTSVLLHAANAVLLLLLLDLATARLWPSAFVAALFAVHPLHVESVAWIAERKDVLSTLFGLLAAIAYVGWTRKGGRGRYALIAGLYAASLMSKPMLVTLPFLLLLLDYWPLGRIASSEGAGRLARDLAARVREKAPLLVLAAASSAVTYGVQRATGALDPLEALPFAARAANAVAAYLRYVALTVAPSGLAAFYPHRSGGIPAGETLAGIAALLAATYLALRLGRRLPYLAVGWLWYAGTLVPVIGLVPVGLQALANRYTYVPLVGLFLIVAWGAADLGRLLPAGGRPWVLGVPAVAAVACLGVAARAEVRYWKDSVTLFERAVAVTSGNTQALCHLATALANQGRVDDAIARYREAIRIDPGHVGALSSLGGALVYRGRIDEAVGPLTEAVRINPRYPQAQYNLGLALAEKGRYEEAAARYSEALRLKPGFAEAHYSLAVAAYRLGDFARALGEAREAHRLGAPLPPGFLSELEARARAPR
jgi:tetratricopeptide (TPR) repeat protein